MKKLFKWAIGVQVLSILLMTILVQRAQAQPGVTVSYQTFYDNLSPYGQWVDDPQYGNVFVPNEGNDFRPYYSRGHWVMTDYGNTWVSDDPWGWACYHYGRWTYDPYYGWVWVPGSEWAPAWVDWRYGGGNCGWAPLGPGISIGVGVYNCPEDWWVFVGPQYLYRNDFYHYWRGPQYNSGYIRSCPFMHNIYRDNGTHVRYNYGPRADQIQGYTHQAVPVYHLSGAERPGAGGVRGNSVSIYRPAVNRGSMNTAHPSNVIRAPHAIGGLHAVSGGQPAFHTALQQGQIRGGAVAPQAGAHGGGVLNQPAHGGALNQPGHQNSGRPMNGGQLQHSQPQMNQPAHQNNGRPMNGGQMQHNQPQMNQPAHQNNGRPMNGGQMQHNQPQMNQPAHQNNGRPMNGGQMQHSQPPMQQHTQQPQMQQHTQQPQMQQHIQQAPRPQPAPRMNGGGGGGRPPMEGGGGHPGGGGGGHEEGGGRR